MSHWLMSLSLDQYVPEFSAQSISGEQLLQLDGNKLKALGMTSSQDRALVKKKTEGNEDVSREGSQGPGENGKTKREAEEEGTRANAEEV